MRFIVNVIIPHWNDYANLEGALASLVAQTKKIFIVTVVDDLSPDQEAFDKVIAKYSNFLQIRVIKNEVNVGPGHARQIGMDAEDRCEYFAFLDSDDRLFPQALEVLYREAKIHNADLVYSDIYVENEQGKYILKLGENTTWFHGKLYRRQFLKDIGLRLDTIDFKYNEDSFFNLCANIAAQKKINVNDELTYLWRNNKNSLTRSMGQQNFIYAHNHDYFLSQVRSIQFLLDHGITPQTCNLGKTLCNLYGAYELEYILYPEHIPEMDKELAKLFIDDRLIKFFQDPQNLMTIVLELRQSKQIGNDMFFYQHSFSSFCHYFGLDFMKEIE